MNLELRNISKNFGGIKSVNNVSFISYKGEITGVIGPNGAGKTTTFNLITGFLSPTTGEIIFNGQAIQHMKPYAIAKQGLVRTFQNPNLFNELTVIENIVIGLECRKNGSVLKDLFNLRGTNKKNEQLRLEAILTSALSAAVAALAGLIFSPLVATNSYMGTSLGIKGFSAAIIGGLGNIPGAVVGGLLIGFIETFGAGYLSPGYRDAFAFIVMLIVLFIMPQGLLNKKSMKIN